MNEPIPTPQGPLRLAAKALRRGPRATTSARADHGSARWRRRRGPVAFVLSSGANLGAVQVGMLRALVEHHVYPEFILGCSVGALNGAGFAQDPTAERVDQIGEVWRTVDSKELMPRQWMSPARALTNRGEAIHPIEGLRQLVERTITVPTFEDLVTPFQCVATDVLAAREHWFDSGPLVDAVLASAAMPAIFPTVEVAGSRYLDGAAVIDVPVRRAAELGARTIFVMEVGPLSRPWAEPKRPTDTAMEAYWIARRHRFQRDLEQLPPKVDVHLLPHGEPPKLKLHDFSRGGELIDRAYAASTAYLDGLVGPACEASEAAPSGAASEDDEAAAVVVAPSSNGRTTNGNVDAAAQDMATD